MKHLMIVLTIVYDLFCQALPHLYLQKDFMLDPIRRCAAMYLRIRDIL
jgi:hypothetical protein